MQVATGLHDVQEPSDSGKMCVQRLGTSRREGKLPFPVKFLLSENKASLMHMFVRILGQPHVQRIDGRSQM